MKVLTATSKTQGQRENDFCFTVEGELVIEPVMECSLGSVDDHCGCRRAMAGLASHRPTTTIMVISRADLDPDTYLELIRDGIQAQGYLPGGLDKQPDVQEWLAQVAGDLLQIASLFRVGTVLERRGVEFTAREE